MDSLFDLWGPKQVCPEPIPFDFTDTFFISGVDLAMLQLHVRGIVVSAFVVAVMQNSLAAEFNPTDLDGLVFFVETVTGLVVATNDSREAYDKLNEFTAIDGVWSDQKRFPHGTVRWWQDQSPYQRTDRNLRIKPNCPFKAGRDFGQDDHDRPGFIPDGCNGKPCVRGGLIPDVSADKGSKHHKQPCYFEMQPGYGFLGEGPFSIYLLARPVRQSSEFRWLDEATKPVIQAESPNRPDSQETYGVADTVLAASLIVSHLGSLTRRVRGQRPEAVAKANVQLPRFTGNWTR